jgi:hypothetical protein
MKSSPRSTYGVVGLSFRSRADAWLIAGRADPALQVAIMQLMTDAVQIFGGESRNNLN